ncbi:hypothetical protein RFI_33683, partial [Reticulomyxa filosa]
MKEKKENTVQKQFIFFDNKDKDKDESRFPTDTSNKSEEQHSEDKQSNDDNALRVCEGCSLRIELNQHSILANKNKKKKKKKKSSINKHIFNTISIVKVFPSCRKFSYKALTTRLKECKLVSINRIAQLKDTPRVKDGGFAVVGVIGLKSLRASSTGNKYLLLTVHDLRESSVACFVFDDKIISQLHNLVESDIVAIVGAKILDSKDVRVFIAFICVLFLYSFAQRDDIALCINDDNQILIAGTAMDFGRCKKVKKDLTQCNNIINKFVR